MATAMPPSRPLSGRTPNRAPNVDMMDIASSSKSKPRPQPRPHQNRTPQPQQDRRQEEQDQDKDENPGGLHFDMLAWYPKYQSCQRYFVDHAQHDLLVQAFAAFINILLPFQRSPATYTFRGAVTAKERVEEQTAKKLGTTLPDMEPAAISLIPYIRRLVCTGMDVPQIMHGFFGNDWQQGVGPQAETERRNFLFSAKSAGWVGTKKEYDMLPYETVPFMRPLTKPHDEELEAADRAWSEWLQMEDWMIGNRSPD